VSGLSRTVTVRLNAGHYGRSSFHAFRVLLSQQIASAHRATD